MKNKQQPLSRALDRTDTIQLLYPKEEKMLSETSSGNILGDYVVRNSDIVLIKVVRFLLVFKRNEFQSFVSMR